MIGSTRLAAGAAALILGTLASPVQATATFLQFIQTSAPRPFSYDGVSTWSGSYTLGIAATYNAGAPDSLFGPFTGDPVTVTLSATTSDALVFIGPDTAAQGGFYGTVTLSTPSITNLLTATFTTGVANWENHGGGWSATLGVSGLCGTTLCFTSDYQIDVLSYILNDFALAFSGGDSIEGPYDAAGTFAGAVPEPASWVLLITGFGFVGFSVRRRRIRVQAS